MTNKRVDSLKRELSVLASDANAQLEHLCSMGLSECIDELALDYDAIAAAANDMLQHDEINREQHDCAMELNDLLKRMSGQVNAHLWTVQALHSAREWKDVRAKANKCLRLFR